MALTRAKKKKMKTYLIIVGVALAVYYFLFKTTKGQAVSSPIVSKLKAVIGK